MCGVVLKDANSACIDAEGRFAPTYDESVTINRRINVVLSIGQCIQWDLLL